MPRVEFLARRLVVVEQMQNPSLSPLKTRASSRVVPRRRPRTQRAHGAHAAWAGRGPRHEPARQARAAQQLRHVLAQAVKAAGLPKGTRFHERHFYASTLIAAGLHPKAIQARLGHATIAETMDIYTCSLTPTISAAARLMPRSATQPMCARCAPGSKRDRSAAGQRLGGGRAGL